MRANREVGCKEVPPPYQNVVEYFREFCGPHDPEIAIPLRPHSLRARFGKSVHKNAVHCTDLPDDGQLEVRIVFLILFGHYIKFTFAAG
jgi:nucleoside-diphosphate kinase